MDTLIDKLIHDLGDIEGLANMYYRLVDGTHVYQINSAVFSWPDSPLTDWYTLYGYSDPLAWTVNLAEGYATIATKDVKDIIGIYEPPEVAKERINNTPDRFKRFFTRPAEHIPDIKYRTPYTRVTPVRISIPTHKVGTLEVPTLIKNCIHNINYVPPVVEV